MGNPEARKVKATITECLPNLLFRVKTEEGKEMLAHLAGRLRINRIRIIAGDNVIIELSPQEDRGRIVYRN